MTNEHDLIAAWHSDGGTHAIATQLGMTPSTLWRAWNKLKIARKVGAVRPWHLKAGHLIGQKGDATVYHPMENHHDRLLERLKTHGHAYAE